MSRQPVIVVHTLDHAVIQLDFSYFAILRAWAFDSLGLFCQFHTFMRKVFVCNMRPYDLFPHFGNDSDLESQKVGVMT